MFNGIEAPVSRQWVEDTRKLVKMPPVRRDQNVLIVAPVSEGFGNVIA